MRSSDLSNSEVFLVLLSVKFCNWSGVVCQYSTLRKDVSESTPQVLTEQASSSKIW